MNGGFTKHEVGMIFSGLLITGVLVMMLTRYFIHVFVPKDPNDPLTKAGGLKPEPPIQSK
jgi:hypothetical protein